MNDAGMRMAARSSLPDAQLSDAQLSDDRPCARRRLRPTIAVGALGALAVAMLWGFLIVDVWWAHRETLRHARASVGRAAETVEAHAVRVFDGANKALTRIIDLHAAAGEAGRTYDPTFAVALRSIVVDADYVEGAIILDRDGMAIYGAPGERIVGVSLAGRQDFQHFSANDDDTLRISPPVVSRASGNRVIVCARRLNAPDGSFAGVALAAINLTVLLDAFGAATLSGDVVALFGSDGTYLARTPDDPALLGRSFADRPLFRDHLPLTPVGSMGPVGLSDGVERLVAYRRIAGYPLVVVAADSLEPALAPWRDVTAIAITTAAFLSLIVAAVTAVGMRQMRAREVMEDALALNGRWTRILLDTTLDGIVAVGEDGTILRANCAVAGVFGLPQQELEGRPVALILPEFMDAAGMSDVFDGRTRDMVGRRGDGALFPAEINVGAMSRTARGAQGGRLFVVAVRDASERERQREDLIFAKEQAEAASRAKSAFLAAMSHELRTPLNAIIGFSEMLLARQAEAPASRTAEFASQIHAGGRQLMSVVDSILDLAKAEADRYEMAEDYIDIGALIDAVASENRPQAEAAGVTLEAAAGGLPFLMADERAIRRVLHSLLSNAVKFNRPGGGVLVTARVDDDGALRVSVSDTGIGMAPEVLGAIGDGFFQGDSGTQRRFGGIGVGLACSRNLMRLHGGTLDLFSREGEGACATIRFPAERVVSTAIPR